MLAALLALLWSGDSRPVRPLRLAGFDIYQTLWPRTSVSAPAVIVEIDDESLARHGQWPWPRTLLAQLVSRIAAADPSYRVRFAALQPALRKILAQ